MDWKKQLADLCTDYFANYSAAAPGWSSYSKTLKISVPGKTQLRTAFIENLNEMKVLCTDDAISAKIDKILKKYQ
jgi:hypothetical protein